MKRLLIAIMLLLTQNSCTDLSEQPLSSISPDTFYKTITIFAEPLTGFVPVLNAPSIPG